MKREARKRLGNIFSNRNYFEDREQLRINEDESDEEEDSDDVEMLRVVTKKAQYTDEQKIQKIYEESAEPVCYTLKKRQRKFSDEAEIQEIPRVDLKKKKMSDEEIIQKNTAESANPMQKTAPKRCSDIADNELIQKIKAETAVKVEKHQQKPEQVPGQKLSRYQRKLLEKGNVYYKKKTDAKRVRRQQMKREAMAAEEQLNDAPVNNTPGYYQY